MKFRADLMLLAALSVLLVAAAPQDAPQPYPDQAGEGPRGTSQLAAGEVRYDEVGRATAFAGTPPERMTVYAAHPTLAAGSFAEVTAIDSGRTILLVITETAPLASDALIALSPAAASQLGLELTPSAPVRVRAVQPSAQDEVALVAGGPAPARLDAPAALLSGLRARLTPVAATASPAPTPPLPPATRPTPPPTSPRLATARSATPAAAPRTGRFVVQVATLSNAANARALATRLNGFTESAGSFTRVRMGPFADRAAADAARGQAVSAGYRDAAVIRLN